MPVEPQPIWTTGDPWRNLTAELAAAGSVTLLTKNGTAHILEAKGGVWRWARVPKDGGHLMPGDLVWHTLLTESHVTPCGARMDTTATWHVTTPIVLGVAGVDTDLAATPAGLAAVDAGHTAPEHPTTVCQHTPYCRARPGDAL